MSDTSPSNPIRSEFQAWFDAWRSCTQDVLSQVSGQANTFETVLEPLPASDSELRYTVVAAGAIQGEMAVRLAESSGLRLARKFVGEPEPPPGSESSAKGMNDESREALEELLRQIGGLAATTIGGSVGGQVQFQLTRAEAPWAWTSDHVATLRTRDEAGVEIGIEIRLSPAVASALAARVAAQNPAPDASSPEPQMHARPEADVGQAAVSVPTRTHNSEAGDVLEPPSDGYRRLLDVGLGVKLRFGTRRMLLRDVLALSSGLVVELENELNSPVDLLLDGRVIARGEVVVIDGKYGLRVTEVVDRSPADRSPAARPQV